MQCFVREIRTGVISRAWNLREGVPRVERAHGEELGDEGGGEGESGEGGDDGTDKARNLRHGITDKEHGDDGACPRWRAVREDLQGAVTRGITSTTQRVFRSPPSRWFAAHHVRDAGLRGENYGFIRR
nr:hypothetical protein Itr_chr07CG17010 [Ipomoea trifida]